MAQFNNLVNEDHNKISKDKLTEAISIISYCSEDKDFRKFLENINKQPSDIDYEELNYMYELSYFQEKENAIELLKKTKK